MKDKIKKTTLTTLSGAIIASNMPLNVFADVLEEINEPQVSQTEDAITPAVEENEVTTNAVNSTEEPVSEQEKATDESITEDIRESLEEDKPVNEDTIDNLIVSEINDVNQTSEETVEQSTAEEKTTDKTQVIVEFQDTNLEKAIRNTLKKQTGDITQADMEKLEYLYADESEISDLTGLEYAVNLTELELSYNNISDISPLSNLTKLEMLNLSYNSVQEIKALEGLTKLENLGLGDNKITDISPLKNAKRLSNVILMNNNITDVSALTGNVGMSGLFLNGNKIPAEEIEELLQDMPNIQVLGLSLDRVIDLSNFDNLEALMLTNSTIEKMSDFNFSSLITQMIVDSSEVNDWSGLECGVLMVTRTKIKDASQLGSYMQGMFYDNDFLDLSGFKEMNTKGLVFLMEQHAKKDIKLFENRMDNPFIEVDGSYITDIDLPDGVTLSEDGSELIFENPVKGDSYEFNAKSYGLAISHIEGFPIELKATFTIAGFKTVEGELVVTENQLSNTEKEVTIEVVDTYYEVDKITLPDGTEVEGSKAVFIATESGDYTIKYVDTQGNEFTQTITVKVDKPVIDKPSTGDSDANKPNASVNQAPIITASNISIPVGYNLDLMSLATATDKEDGDLDAKIISSNFDNTKPGVYNVTYQATDSKGLSTTKTIHIAVRDLSEDENSYTKDIVIAPNEKLDIDKLVNEIAKDKGLTDVEILENNVNTSKPGDYSVVFEGTNTKKEQEIHSIKVTVVTGTSNDKEDDSSSTNKPSGESVETGLTSGATITLGGLFTLAGISFLKRKRK